MLVTIGEHRFNLINITKVQASDRAIYFVDCAVIVLGEAEFEAFKKFWDSHGEIIRVPEAPTEAVNDTTREFVIGAEEPPADPAGQ